MSEAKPEILAAIAPLLSEKAMLLGEQHARSFLARVAQVFSVELRADDPPAQPKTAVPAGVACIPIIGILTKYPTPFDEWCELCPTMGLMETLREAVADSTVSAIVLDIDSPGGFVNGTVEFADAVAAANQIKPVIANIRGLCCSGAYWIASQCGKIVSRREAEVGNIGVYSVLADVSKFYEQLGVSFTLVATGPYKGLGADGKVTDDLKSDTARIINGLFQQFVNAVATGRGLELAEAQELADGRAYLGNQAKTLGLVDEISSSFEATLQSISSGAVAPENGVTSMATTTTPAPGAAQATAPATAAKPDDNDGSEGTMKMLQDTISSAADHKSQVRESMDHAQEHGEDMDDESKSLAKKAATALRATSEESERCAKAWLAAAGEDPDEDAPKPTDDDDDESKQTAAAYISAFGDAGARWFVEKKPFAQAAKEYIAKLKADHEAETTRLKAENAELQKRLNAMPRGNEEALASVPERANTGTKKKHNGLSDGLNRFAAGIRFSNQEPGAN